jgi:HEAT repeat protein
MRAYQPRPAGTGRVALEGPPRLIVLVRAEAGRVERVETLSPECAIDAGGRTLHWLEGLAPAQSLALLAGLASRAGHDEEVMENALAAISMHAGREADTLLVDLARRGSSGELRGQALFWLAQRAGEEAVKAIRTAVQDDPEREVKLQAVFALSELPNQEGVPLLIDVASTHRDPEVRRQAFFWLGEAEDPRALAFFEQVLLGPRERR